jgi:broad specificity phosphatase PhoE
VSGTIYLVRHGQTALNAEGRFRGRRDVPLDDRGFVQAADASHQLMGTGVKAVYTSPLLRCVQTAEFIAHACGVRITRTEDLIDLDHGTWEGLTPEEAAGRDSEAFERFRQDPRNAAAPGGEQMADVEARVLAALRWMADQHEEDSVAAVSHEIPIRLVIASLARIKGEAFWGVVVPTGSVTRIGHEPAVLTLMDEVLMGATP